VSAVRDGMATIIPVPLLSLVTSQHLEQLVCGMPNISIDVLKKVVRLFFCSAVIGCFSGCQQSSDFFFDISWKVLRKMKTLDS